MPSTIIKNKCIFCGKTANEVSREVYKDEVAIKLSCGHTVIEIHKEALEEKPEEKYLAIQSFHHNKKPFPFQAETAAFMEKSGFKTGVFHEQGLGKTTCALLPIRLHEQDLLPFAVFCKSSLKVQWLAEIYDWLNIPAQIIDNGKDKPYPELFRAFIISLDLLKRIDWVSQLKLKYVIIDECQLIKNPNAKRTQAVRQLLAGKTRQKRQYSKELKDRRIVQTIGEDLIRYHGLDGRFTLNFERLSDGKLGLTECYQAGEGIIKGRITLSTPHALYDELDEVIETILHEIAHAITPGAGHRPIWRDTAISIGSSGEQFAWCSGSVVETDEKEDYSIPHVVALSGTPIKNHAAEYFPILNILRPTVFHSQTNFEREYVDSYWNGYTMKYGGLKESSIDRFKSITQDFIIRYDRETVLPDLPKVFRQSRLCELGDDVNAAYRRAMKEFADAYDEGNQEAGSKFEKQSNLMAKLAKLRHLTGLAKVQPVVDYVADFLVECDRKIVLFYHHKDVGLALYTQLKEICKDGGFQGPAYLSSEFDSTRETREDIRFKTDPACRIMIASTLASGEGKNWQMCSDMLMVERQWNPANEEQCEGRFPRPGSKASSVNAIYMNALGTPDEYLNELVERKRAICRQTLGHEHVEWDESSLMTEMMDAIRWKGGKKWSIH